MSGGVDSSVSAWLLKNKGYEVEGLFMKNWEEDDSQNYCASKKDLEDVKIICKQLNIRLHKVNFSTEYWNNVFKIFLQEYKLGKTPNPDILCNREIKFKEFLNFSKKQFKADFIATGHYAQIKDLKNEKVLIKAKDRKKDQSYYLYTLKSNILKKILFPIGNLYKYQVRNIANTLNFVNADKKDSTGICFIENRKKSFKNFLSRYLPSNTGEILNVKGKIIGKHYGAIYYTIGQRKGLGIGGIKNNHNKSCWYVADKNIKKNQLLVVQGKFNPYLISIGFYANELNWINKKKKQKRKLFSCQVKIRAHQKKDIFCDILLISKDEIDVYFHEYVSSISPGQSAVFYKENICLGGGIIQKTFSLKQYFRKNI